MPHARAGVRLWFRCVTWVLLLTPVASRQLTVARVAQGENLQAAIDAARPGETILLAPGARFVGNFVLPARPEATSFITIRTDADDLPREGVRTGPEHATRLATIRSPNNQAAIRTAPGAHHWRLENLALEANADGHGNIIELGQGTQRDRATVPHTLVLDRLLVRGDPVAGQKRGIALNSANTEIRNSYIAGIRGVGMDTQAVAGWNGPGPYLIENNYLEAAGENVMFGGSDPLIPGLVPEGIVIRRNLLTKPEGWRGPIVVPPVSVDARPATEEDGTLAPGTYTYRVVSERPAGQGTTAVSAPSEPVEVTIGSTGAVRLTWPAVSDATGYRVFRAGPDGTSVGWKAAEPHFTDAGTPGREGSPPAKPTMWEVKNLLELKNARNVTIDGNVLERNWLAAQAGYAVVLKSESQNGRAPWTIVENVRVTNNIVRHVGSAITIVGVAGKHPSQPLRQVTIANNLLIDVSGKRWGGAGDFLKVGEGASDIIVEQNTVDHDGRVIAAQAAKRLPPVERFVFRNNLLRHNKYGVKGDGTDTGRETLARYFPGAIFMGNVLAGGPRTRYPEGNEFPGAGAFDAQFVDAPGGDYRLKGGATVTGAGADLARIEAATGPGTTAPGARATPQRNRE